MSLKYTIGERIEELPKAKYSGKRIEAYDKMVEELLSRPNGIYPVNVEGKHTKTLYSALIDRIKDKPLKLHVREKVLYVEKLD